MKAKGEVMGQLWYGRYVGLTWTPGDGRGNGRNYAYMETESCPSAKAARRVAKAYAQKLGLKIEWEKENI